MSERREYEMSQAQFDAIMDASKPTPAMFLSGGQSMAGTPHENAMRAWERLGRELGFEPMSARPSQRSKYHFTAVPTTAADPADPTPPPSEDERP